MEAPIEIGASIREKGRMSSIGYLFGQLGLLVDGLNRLDRLGFLVGDLTGRELGFELLDDFGVYLLVDLHLEHEHQQAEHDQVERHIEGADFEGVDVRGGHVGGGRVTGHTCRNGDEADDAVRQGATDTLFKKVFSK